LDTVREYTSGKQVFWYEDNFAKIRFTITAPTQCNIDIHYSTMITISLL